MDSQNRFHFLNLWDDTADESETREGEERKEFIGDEQSVCMGSSQWMNGRPVSGKCVLDGCRLPPAFFLNLSESNVWEGTEEESFLFSCADTSSRRQ